MKTYFERLRKIGVEAVSGLRQLEAQHLEMQKSYHELLTKGDITPAGYDRYLKDLDRAHERFISGYGAQLEALKAEFAEATDHHTTPTSSNMNTADMEILKNFELSPTEFESLARKYDNNATMGRMLEKYRTDHNVNTDWRYQTADQRKQIFNDACNSVYHIMNQSDKYCPARIASVEYHTAKAYHRLQGSVAEVMPVPADPTPAPSTVFFNDTAIAAATGVNGAGEVYTCF